MHGEEEKTFLTTIRCEINDGLLVSMEIITNPAMYRYLCEVVNNRVVLVPSSVTDKTAGYFVAKPIIATIWQNEERKVKRDSLLLKYHNLRQHVG